MSISGILSRELNAVSFKGVVTPFVAVSDYENAIGEITSQASLKNLSAYFTRIDGVNSVAQVGQTWNPTTIDQSFMLGQIKVPIYQINTGWRLDVQTESVIDETLARANAGGNSVMYLNYISTQAVAQKIRLMALFGAKANEGILYGATNYDIGNDPAGASKLTAMQTDFLAMKLSLGIQKLISAVKNTDYYISMLCSQRVYNYLTMTTIDSTKYISTGSAVTIAQYLKNMVREHGKELAIGFDPMFENADTTAQKDLIFINVPKCEKQKGDTNIAGSVNEFASSVDSIDANTVLDLNIGFDYLKSKEINAGVTERTACYTASAGITLREESAIKIEIEYQ